MADHLDNAAQQNIAEAKAGGLLLVILIVFGISVVVAGMAVLSTIAGLFIGANL